MYNLDLFDDVTVSLDDVELWLRCIPRFDDTTRASHVRDYIVNYDVVNKITVAKLDKSFYSLKSQYDIDLENLSRAILPMARCKLKPCAFLPRSMIRHSKAA